MNRKTELGGVVVQREAFSKEDEELEGLEEDKSP